MVLEMTDSIGHFNNIIIEIIARSRNYYSNTNSSVLVLYNYKMHIGMYLYVHTQTKIHRKNTVFHLISKFKKIAVELKPLFLLLTFVFFFQNVRITSTLPNTLKSILILSSYPRLGFPNGVFPSGL
jgi:hypothetical protein